jgi:hypothetical protein
VKIEQRILSDQMTGKLNERIDEGFLSREKTDEMSDDGRIFCP